MPQLSSLHEAPGSCFILWALALHTTQWGSDATIKKQTKKKLSLLLLESGRGNSSGPKLSRHKHTNWKEKEKKKDRRFWGISRKSSPRQRVRNAILTEKTKRQTRAGGEREPSLWFSKSTSKTTKILVFFAVKKKKKKSCGLYSQEEDERNEFFREQNIDRETCKNCTGRWTGTGEERETEGEDCEWSTGYAGRALCFQDLLRGPKFRITLIVSNLEGRHPHIVTVPKSASVQTQSTSGWVAGTMGSSIQIDSFASSPHMNPWKKTKK